MSKTKYKNRKYSIESYNPEWVEMYKNESTELQKCLDENIISIEHIGSTSVPQLAGKPTIDILVTIENIEEVDFFINGLESLGYKYLGQYVMQNSRLFVKEKNDTRLINLHFYTKNHFHVTEMLHLRGYLRSHPETVKEYTTLKFDLVEKYPNDYGSYRKYKDEWMNKLKTNFSFNREKLDEIILKNKTNDWWKPKLFTKNTLNLLPKELEILKNPTEEEINHNCFIYAFGLADNHGFISETNGFIFGTFVKKLIDKNKLTKTNNPSNGDYVIYQDLENYPDSLTHIGVITGDKIVSKWAWGPLVKHDLWDVPKSYGNNIFYLKAIGSENFLELYEEYKSFNVKD